MDISMNEASGRKLYELCLPYMSWEKGMDFGDFIEEICIPIDRLNWYFNGQRSLGREDLARFAHVCRMDVDELMGCLEEAYAEPERIRREEEEKEKRMEQWRQECRQRKEKEEALAAKEAEILAELKEYGIDRVYRDSKEYPIEEYYPLKFIMRYLRREEGLIKLEALLKGCTDEQLVHTDTNALIWAADSDLSYEILRLLKGRKAFIARFIRQKDRKGQTALHHYVQRHSANPDGIDLLIGWGADPNAKDDYLWTPLHDAENCQSDSLAGRLLKYGAKSSVDIDGHTPEDIRFRQDAIDAW